MVELNHEAVLDELSNFEKRKRITDIPDILDKYLESIAMNGDTIFPWCKLQPLIRGKLELVLNDLHEKCPTHNLPVLPNVEPFDFEDLKLQILESIESFPSAPFTIQRICEMVTNPQKHYKRTDKFMRAIEKNIRVVSTIEPREFGDESSFDDSPEYKNFLSFSMASPFSSPSTSLMLNGTAEDGRPFDELHDPHPIDVGGGVSNELGHEDGRANGVGCSSHLDDDVKSGMSMASLLPTNHSSPLSPLPHDHEHVAGVDGGCSLSNNSDQPPVVAAGNGTLLTTGQANASSSEDDEEDEENSRESSASSQSSDSCDQKTADEQPKIGLDSQSTPADNLTQPQAAGDQSAAATETTTNETAAEAEQKPDEAEAVSSCYQADHHQEHHQDPQQLEAKTDEAPSSDSTPDVNDSNSQLQSPDSSSSESEQAPAPTTAIINTNVNLTTDTTETTTSSTVADTSTSGEQEFDDSEPMEQD